MLYMYIKQGIFASSAISFPDLQSKSVRLYIFYPCFNSPYPLVSTYEKNLWLKLESLCLYGIYKPNQNRFVSV